jgi:hypothetical protein
MLLASPPDLDRENIGNYPSKKIVKELLVQLVLFIKSVRNL